MLCNFFRKRINYFCIKDYGHKIRIPLPAWDNMDMQVSGDAGACHLGDVDPDIVPLWPKDLVEQGSRLAHGMEQVKGLRVA